MAIKKCFVGNINTTWLNFQIEFEGKLEKEKKKKKLLGYQSLTNFKLKSYISDDSMSFKLCRAHLSFLVLYHKPIISYYI